MRAKTTGSSPNVSIFFESPKLNKLLLTFSLMSSIIELESLILLKLAGNCNPSSFTESEILFFRSIRVPLLSTAYLLCYCVYNIVIALLSINFCFIIESLNRRSRDRHRRHCYLFYLYNICYR